MSNPFKVIENIYNDGVVKNDEDGYAELYKTATEEIIYYIENEYPIITRKHRNCKVEDVEYLDGYFIFGMGTNSVVHFHVDKCPGWKFGIWWGKPENGLLKGELFTQPEKFIDKFKPTASVFSTKIELECDADMNKVEEASGCYDIHNIINYIAKNKCLAFCRDQYLYNYNKEYVSKFKAFRLYCRSHFKDWLEDNYTSFADKLVLNKVRRKVLPTITEGKAVIEDCGEGWSPRYQIVCEMPYETPDDELGAFNIPKEDFESVYKLMDKLSKIAFKLAIYYFKCIQNYVIFYNQKKLEECEENDGEEEVSI